MYKYFFFFFGGGNVTTLTGLFYGVVKENLSWIVMICSTKNPMVSHFMWHVSWSIDKEHTPQFFNEAGTDPEILPRRGNKTKQKSKQPQLAEKVTGGLWRL